MKGVSPIGTDGGFGPADSERYKSASEGVVLSTNNNIEENQEGDVGEELGDDFNDFEAGAVDEEFGDFNDELQPSLAAQEREQGDYKASRISETLSSHFVSRFKAPTGLIAISQFLFLPSDL